MLLLPCGVLLLRCGSADDSKNPGVPSGTSGREPPAAAPTVSGSQAIYTSSQDSAHYHIFAIPLGDLTSSQSNGVSGDTSENDGHTHTVSVSTKDVQDLHAGQTVAVTTSFDAGHEHVFTFVKVTGSS